MATGLQCVQFTGAPVGNAKALLREQLPVAALATVCLGDVGCTRDTLFLASLFPLGGKLRLDLTLAGFHLFVGSLQVIRVDRVRLTANSLAPEQSSV